MGSLFVTVLVLSTLTAIVSGVGCPNGWARYTESCYYFHTDTRVSWSDAVQDCSNHHGSHLAAVDSFYEMLFISSQLNDLRRGRDLSTYNIWIGGTDDTQEGTWLWANSDELLEYTYWDNGEPGTEAGSQQNDCLSLSGQSHFKWRSDDCHKDMFFICEMRDPDYYNGGQTIIG